MERIETERDWFECDETRLFRPASLSVAADHRFRFLALRWAKKFVHHLSMDWERDWFQALEKWVTENQPDSRMECYTQIFVPLVTWAPRSPGRAIQSFFFRLRDNRICQAAIEAGEAASQDTPFPQAEFDRVKLTYQGKSQRKREARNVEEDRIRTQWWVDHDSRKQAIGREFCDEFRDVAGNPFRPVTFDPAWRTSPVLDLAQTIDREQKYDLLPILADVLEESGCHLADILDHCRSNQRHVKGCWVIDLALGVINSLHAKQ